MLSQQQLQIRNMDVKLYNL